MEPHLKIAGTLLIGLALLHLIFPKYFNWSTELAPLSLINKQMMYVHTFFIGLMILLMGIFCLASANEIAGTRLGRQLALGLSIFWGARLLFQFFVYSPVHWKGKRFESMVHVFLSVLWIYFTAIFFLVYWE
ncbi:MAG TPA: hypothetical protein VD772_05680 [Anseongella sp.]|nr:hypothetical protein [Anseongella sp.]